MNTAAVPGNTEPGNTDPGNTVPVIAVVGPTATGKSDLGVALAARARRRGGQRRLDAALPGHGHRHREADRRRARGRAAPPARRLDVTETAAVADYQTLARDASTTARPRAGRRSSSAAPASTCEALLDELEFPGTDPASGPGSRPNSPRSVAPPCTRGWPQLDPAAAAAILPGNGRRIVRALEVIELTGRPFSATMPKPGPPRYGTVLIGLDRPAELDERVERRVERMFAGGLVDEVRGLLDVGLRDGRTASRALGYQQVLRCLEPGSSRRGGGRRPARDPALRRRQGSWFRRDPRVALAATRPVRPAGGRAGQDQGMILDGLPPRTRSRGTAPRTTSSSSRTPTGR